MSQTQELPERKLELPQMPKIDTPEPEEAFRNWVAGSAEPGRESPTLAYSAHHLESFHAYTHLPNIHVFHYADLKQDLAGEMKRVARALEIDVEPERTGWSRRPPFRSGFRTAAGGSGSACA